MNTARSFAALAACAVLGSAAPAAARTTGTLQLLETSPLPVEVTTSPLAPAVLGQAAGQAAGAPAAPRVTAGAREILDQVRQAYTALENLEVTGTLSTDFEVAGRVEKTVKRFSGAFRAPDRFRHQVENEFVAGSTGEKSYVHNLKSNQYMVSAPATESAPLRNLPGNLVGLLQSQNPSLLTALARDPLAALAGDARSVDQTDDVKVDGKQYSALRLTMPQGRGEIVVLVDKETHLLRRVTVDMKPGLDRAGVAGVKSATFVIDYTRTRPDADFPKGYFAWTPPPGATPVAPPEGGGEGAGTGVQGEG